MGALPGCVIKATLHLIILGALWEEASGGFAVDAGTEFGVATSFSKGVPSDPGTSTGDSSECWTPFAYVSSSDLFTGDCTLSPTSTCFTFASEESSTFTSTCTYSGTAQTNSDNIANRLTSSGDSAYYFRFRGNTEEDSYFYPESEHWWAPEVKVGGGDVICQLPEPVIDTGYCLTQIEVVANFSRVHKKFDYDEDNDGEDETVTNEKVRTTGCLVYYTTGLCSSATGITFKMHTSRCIYQEEYRWAVEGLMKSVGIWIISIILLFGGPFAIILWPALPIFIVSTIAVVFLRAAMCCLERPWEGGGDELKIIDEIPMHVETVFPERTRGEVTAMKKKRREIEDDHEGGGGVGIKPPTGPPDATHPSAPAAVLAPPVDVAQAGSSSPFMGAAPAAVPMQMPPGPDMYPPQQIVIQPQVFVQPQPQGMPMQPGVTIPVGPPPDYGESLRSSWCGLRSRGRKVDDGDKIRRVVTPFMRLVDVAFMLIVFVEGMLVLTYIPLIIIVMLAMVVGAILFSAMPFFIVLFGFCTLITSSVLNSTCEISGCGSTSPSALAIVLVAMALVSHFS